MQEFDPLQDGKSLLKLRQYMGDDQMIVDAARVSLAEDGGDWDDVDDPKLINFLINHKHNSPLEHCFITFIVKTPIAISNQWRRHRTFPYFTLNEVSRRYTDEAIEFHIPSVLRQQGSTNRQASEGEVDSTRNRILIRQIEDHAGDTYKLYQRLIMNGVAREQARFVLSQNLYTRFYATSNLHNLFHFLTLRKASDAQPEIAVYAEAMAEITKELFPVAWEGYERVDY